MTQCGRIVRHLHVDLRDQGYDISAERRTSKNRYGESTTYAVYKLKE